MVLKRSTSVTELHQSRADQPYAVCCLGKRSVRACLLPPQEIQDCVSSWSLAEEGARAGDKEVVYVRLLLVFRLNLEMWILGGCFS